jgi:hypothetical protein
VKLLAGHAKHVSMLAMLHPIVAALSKRGISASHFFPGYIQIDRHDFVYAPTTDHWSFLHTKDTQGPWTRLVNLQDERRDVDAEWIADKISAHISATKGR